jgi:hypothetical protein
MKKLILTIAIAFALASTVAADIPWPCGWAPQAPCAGDM